LDSLKRSGQRGVVATGWNGLLKVNNIPENVIVLHSIPHAWLFPRMPAVVHHRGAGTTAADLRSGMPGIIIPFSNDQISWGRHVYELGTIAKPIPRMNLTGGKLSEAIKFVLTDEIIHRQKTWVPISKAKIEPKPLPKS